MDNGEVQVRNRGRIAAIGAAMMVAGPALAQQDIAALRQQLVDERARLESQQQVLDAQRGRLQALESALAARLGEPAVETAAAATVPPGSIPLPPSPPPTNGGVANGVPTVGEAPTDQRQVQVAVLAEQGGVITQAGRLTIEADLEYARADRNRVLFRGVAIPEAVLIGAFDINESRQNVFTAAVVGRLGLTGRLEVNGRAPFIRRTDNSALAPVVNQAMPGLGVDRSVSNSNLGDIDFGARYQFTDGRNGFPFLIAGVQAVAPTGTDPFGVPRDPLGNPLQAATGAGFWGVTPTLTAILPTDPAVLFGTFGYTFNIGRDVGRWIGPAFLERVTPGGSPAASVGVAVSLNPRTSLSFGYAHTVALGTRTRLRTIDPQTGAMGDSMRIRTRDLQLGRLLFGMSYRPNARTTINWNVEVGATEDASDVRTTLRIPLSLDIF